MLLETIQAAIYAHMEDVEADDYYGDYDIDDLLKQNMRYNGYYEDIDTESVVDTICDFIKEDGTGSFRNDWKTSTGYFKQNYNFKK